MNALPSQKLILWLALLSLVCAASDARAQLPAKPQQASMLQRVFGLEWAADKDQTIQAWQSRPGVKRSRDWKGIAMLRGGDLHGQPVGETGLKFFGEKLIRVDAKLDAPGDVDRHYEQYQKKLTALLQVAAPTVGRDGNRRKSVWKVSTGGPSGKGEIVELLTGPGKNRIQVFVHDPAYSNEH